jgi:DNA-binding NarL/FixJ family response regulator
MRVLLVDDHVLLRQCMADFLRSGIPPISVDEAVDYDEALLHFASEECDVVVTDIGLKGRSGLELIERLVAARSGFPIVVLSMHEDLDHLAQALRAGARGYVSKSSDSSELRTALATVYAGGLYLDQAMLSLVACRLAGAPAKSREETAGDLRELTDREREVFSLLIKDTALDAIGGALGISTKTVENHRSAIYGKLGLSDRFALFHYARRLGLTN